MFEQTWGEVDKEGKYRGERGKRSCRVTELKKTLSEGKRGFHIVQRGERGGDFSPHFPAHRLGSHALNKEYEELPCELFKKDGF